MKLRTTILLCLCLMASANVLKAQRCISFEQSDFAAIGVYDTWEQSPFRTGKLQGNAAIVSNPFPQSDPQLGYAPNPTPRVLAFQRSRFGSNTFGVRIDLTEPFLLHPTTSYVHILLHRPVEGRVMLIGLGRRTELKGKRPEVEQFWVQSMVDVPADKWADAVFPVKGAEGIEIHSLVLIPQLESTHDLLADYAVFVDEIEINHDDSPRIQREDYPLNFSMTSTLRIRSDRGIAKAGTATQYFDLSPTIAEGVPLYTDCTDSIIYLSRTAVVEPCCLLRGNWMNTFCYIDYNRNGRFDLALDANNMPTDASELVSYSHYNGFNSAHEPVGEGNTAVLPPFSIPAWVDCGFYRLRYKSDWNNLYAGGNVEADNHIQQNGGAIADFTVNIHPACVSLTEDNRNGDILNADGTPLAASAPFMQPLTVRLRPENGFICAGLRLRHGYNHQGPAVVHGVVQYRDLILPASRLDENGCITIPATLVDGDLTLEGLFVQQSP